MCPAFQKFSESKSDGVNKVPTIYITFMQNKNKWRSLICGLRQNYTQRQIV